MNEGSTMGLFRRKAEAVIEAPPVVGTEPDQHQRSAVQAGVPGRCPECDGFGYIDHIDMINRTQSQHCRECGHVWSFRFDEDGDVLDLTDGALAAEDDRTAH
jgi:hypothetical protein